MRIAPSEAAVLPLALGWIGRLATSLLFVSALGGCYSSAAASARDDRRVADDDTYGWVLTQSVDLVAVRARVELASRCRHRPGPSKEQVVLRKKDVEAAKCRTRPFGGTIGLTGITPKGARIELPVRIPVSEGRFVLPFSSLGAWGGAEGLQRFAFIELGERGWAGSINLDSLRVLRASWHLHWIARGRGAASLFVAAHPRAPQIGEVRALGVEAQLARQEADYLAVGRGELSARAFLERHLWSPYRVSVREMRVAAGESSPP